MKTDRELLELAAKAFGMPPPKFIDGWYYSKVGPYGEGLYKAYDRTNHQFWNPLINDGDALRLAVRLSMQLGSNAESDIVGASWAEVSDRVYCSQPHNGDALAATRRAIVRAAAEIGSLP